MAGAAGRRNILRELSSSGSNGFQSNIPSSNLAATPTSPDETVIQHRGQQKKSATYKYNAPDPVFFKTPTKQSPRKDPSKSGLRSSPRKRLLMSPDKMSQNEEGMAELSISGKRAKKIVECPTDFEKSLKALSHGQLVTLICATLKECPGLKEVMEKFYPVPDISTPSARLYKLQRNVFKSVPRNVYGSQDGSFCYLRVRSHLEAFKEECMEVCNQLVESQLWYTALEYILYSLKLTSELPNWNNMSHNKTKNICKKYLITKFVDVIKKADLDSGSLSEVIEKLKGFSKDPDSDHCFSVAKQLLETAQLMENTNLKKKPI